MTEYPKRVVGDVGAALIWWFRIARPSGEAVQLAGMGPCSAQADSEYGGLQSKILGKGGQVYAVEMVDNCSGVSSKSAQLLKQIFGC